MGHGEYISVCCFNTMSSLSVCGCGVMCAESLVHIQPANDSWKCHTSRQQPRPAVRRWRLRIWRHGQPHFLIFFCNLPDLPDATVTVANGGQTGLKVFIKRLTQAPNFRILLSGALPYWQLFAKLLFLQEVRISKFRHSRSSSIVLFL